MSGLYNTILHFSVWFVQNDATYQCLVCTKRYFISVFGLFKMMLHISVWFVQNDTTHQCLVCTKALATITRIYLHLGNNNEKLELPERLSTGIQFRNTIPVQESISRKKIG